MDGLILFAWVTAIIMAVLISFWLSLTLPHPIDAGPMQGGWMASTPLAPQLHHHQPAPAPPTVRAARRGSYCHPLLDGAADRLANLVGDPCALRLSPFGRPEILLWYSPSLGYQRQIAPEIMSFNRDSFTAKQRPKPTQRVPRVLDNPYARREIWDQITASRRDGYVRDKIRKPLFQPRQFSSRKFDARWTRP